MPAPPRAGPAPQFGTRHLIRVVINAAEGPGTYSREAELRGLVTVMMESGLADLPDVVPEVEGRGPSPGLARPLKLDEHVWTGLLKVEGEAPSLTLSFTLCSPEGPCAGMTSTTTVDRPEEALVELLRGSARALARSPSAEAEARWAEPVSMDSYGALLLGRSAAVWYGLMEPPPPELVGDHRADAITRAVLVDPSMSQAWWIRGRRAWALADLPEAWESSQMATEMAPSWPASQADAAALLSRWGKAERAAEAWELVARAAPRDLRFVLPIAQARLAAGEADEAARALDALPGGAARDPDVISLRVAIADAVLPGGAGDSLLEQWQEIASEDPLPVRRRIALRIREGDYTEALDFIPELAARGEELAARRLEMGLAVGVGQWERGALAAEAAGDVEMARRIRGRGALEADPASVPEGLEEVTDPAGVLVLARALLAANQARGALLEVRALLEQNPYNPDALAILAECLHQMGDEKGAEEARRKLYLADPDFSSAWPGPSTAPGSTGAGAQSQAAPEE